MRLFISYAHVDKTIVQDWIVSKLVAGGHDVWFDTRLVAGQEWKQQLSDEIKRSDALVYCITPESIASEWCQWELARAVEFGKPVVPVLMQARTKIPDSLSQLQYVDFSDGPTGDAVARLMGGLQQLSPTQIPPAPIHPKGYPARLQGYEDQRRQLEVAMPACTKLNSDTKLKLKISLPGSPGLSAELPEVLPSGDIIQQSDVRSSGFELRFPVDSQTGQLKPGDVCIKIETNEFDVRPIGAQTNSCPSDHYHLLVSPTEDTRTLNFVLTPKAKQQTGLASIYIFLYQNDKLVVDTYVETQLVASMDQLEICGNWRLQVAMLKWSAGNVKPNMMKTLSYPATQAIIGIIGVLIAVVALLGSGSGGSNPEPTRDAELPTPMTPIVVALRDLDIRSGPDADFPRLNILPVDGILDILGISEDRLWYQVLLSDGRRGWVLAASTGARLEGDRGVVGVIIPTLTPSHTPTDTSTPTDTPTPTAIPEQIRLFRDDGSITLYVPEGRTIDLNNWYWGRTAEDRKSLASYVTFGSGQQAGPACFRLEYQHAGQPDVPDLCLDEANSRYQIKTIAASDVFWYSPNPNRHYAIKVFLEDDELITCTPDAQECIVPFD